MLHIPTDVARHALEVRRLPSMQWSLDSIFNVIRWRKWLIIWPVIIAGILAMTYCTMTDPKYTATTVMVTDTKRSPSEGQADGGVDMVVVESQNEVLQSDKIALAVIDKLKLWDDPEFIGPNLMSQIIAVLKQSGPRPPMPLEVKRQIAVGRFKKALSVKRAGRSYVSEISFTSTDKKKAADIANAIAEAYIADQLSAKLQIAERSNAWIEARIKKLRDQAGASAQAVADFRTKNKISIDNNRYAQDPERPLTPVEQELRDLEAKAQSDKTIYETFTNRYTQSEQIQQQSFPVTEARVLAEAQPPLSKSEPKTSLILFLALCAGGTIGVIAAFAREALQRPIRGPRQLESELGLRVLGVVPNVPRRPSLLSRGGPLRLIDQARHSLFSHAHPHTTASESIRGVKIAIDRAAGGEHGQGRMVGISSPRPGAGKTTLAYNLAVLSARCGRRTLLIDADLRNPTLTRSLAPNHPNGLSTLLNGNAEFGECVTEPIPQLHFIGEASSEAGAHPSDLLSSTAMTATLARLRQMYDYIIIDLPSLLDHVDVRASASLINAFVIVTEWRKTSITDLDAALASCDLVVERLVGVTINKAQTTQRK
jgi:capsular exopolysaccharide synthesis family protein